MMLGEDNKQIAERRGVGGKGGNSPLVTRSERGSLHPPEAAVESVGSVLQTMVIRFAEEKEDERKINKQ